MPAASQFHLRRTEQISCGLTSIILYTYAPEAVVNMGQGCQACHEPTVAQVALLDVVAAGVLHESRALKDFVDALDGFGRQRSGKSHGRLGNVELIGAESVEAVAAFVLEIPILCRTS